MSGADERLEVDALRQGIQAHQQGNMAEAEACYRRVLSVHPAQPDAHHLLGLLAIAMGKHAEAVYWLDQAILLAPGTSEFHNSLGVAHAGAGQLELAASSYEMALRLRPQFPAAANNLGNILRRQGDFEGAVDAYRRALAIQPDYADAHNNLGIALRELGRLDEAIECYRQALVLRPSFFEAANNLGNTWRDRGRPAEAADCYRRALATRPNFVEAYNNLGLMLRELGRNAEGVACFVQAIAIQADYAEAHCNLGVAYTAQKRFQEAHAAFLRALAIKPHLVEAHVFRAEAFLEQGSLGDAVECIRTADRLDQGQAGYPHYAIGIFAARCDENNIAIKHLRNCLAHDAEDRHGVRILLARLGDQPIPDRASDAFLEKLYATRAAYWEQDAGKKEGYRAHHLVADALKSQWKGVSPPRILDAGCGTGLVGELLKDFAQTIDGVDLSPAMLDRARDKGIYSRLQMIDLIEWMREYEGAYDMIACAATLVHFGDLRAPFSAAATCLRDEGLFAMTLFPKDVEAGNPTDLEQKLAQGGCYAHSRAEVREIAESEGFQVLNMAFAVHEYVQGVPTVGMVVLLRRQLRQGWNVQGVQTNGSVGIQHATTAE